MKRFTDTDKWRDPWFRLLSSPAKQLWGYMCDNCDCIGLIELNLKLVSADVGQKINAENVKELGDRIQDLGGNRYFIPKFINFQYGEISDKCPAHRPVIRQINQRGLLREGIAYRYPSDTLFAQSVANQQNQYPSARVAIPLRQDRIGQDRIGEGGAGGNNDKLPVGFPDTAEEAKAHAAFVGCSEEFAVTLWNTCVGRGGKDAKGIQIRSFRHHLAAVWQYHQERVRENGGNGKPDIGKMPLGLQVQALKSAILEHPANKESVLYNANCTDLEREGLRNMRHKLKDLESKITQGIMNGH